MIDISNTEFTSHICSEGMKSLLFDCLRDKKSRSIMSNPHYLLNIKSDHRAVAYFFDSNYSFIQNSLNIPFIQNGNCMTCIEEKLFQRYLLANKDQIILYTVTNKEEFQENTVKENMKKQIGLQRDEKILYLSRSICLDTANIIVAYTTQNNFYLIAVENKDMKVTKLRNLDEPKKSIFSFNWFSKKQHPSYKQIELFLFDQHQISFKILLVRDSSISILEVVLERNFNDSTIKSEYQQKLDCGNEKELRQVLMLAKDSGIYENWFIFGGRQSESQETAVVYYAKYQVKKNIDSFNIIKSSSNLDVADLFMAIYQNSMFFQFYDKQEQKFKIVMRPLGSESIVTQTLLDQQPLFRSKTKIIFSISKTMLYFMTESDIYTMLESQKCMIDQNASLQKNQYFKFSAKIQKSLDKRIKKYGQLDMFEETIILLKQKQKQMVNWLQYRAKIDHEIEIDIEKQISSQVITTNVLYHLLKHPDFEILRKTLRYSNSNSEDKKLIYNAINEQTPESLSRVLVCLPEINLYHYLITILKQIRFHELTQNNLQIGCAIFKEAVKKSLLVLKEDSNFDLQVYKQLISYSVAFIKDDQEVIYKELKHLTDAYGEDYFVKEIILNQKILGVLISFFTESPQITFTADNIRQLCGYLFQIGTNQMHDFLNKMLSACQKKYKEGGTQKQLILTKMPILVKGFLVFVQEEQFFQIIKQYFPGLVFYFYLLRRARIEGRQQIQALAQKVKSASHAYMLLLSVHCQGKLQSKENLSSARICAEANIQMKNKKQLQQMIAHGTFIKKSGKHKISKQSWNAFIKSSKCSQKVLDSQKEIVESGQK